MNTAPSRLIDCDRRIRAAEGTSGPPARFSVCQCRTIPHCESVKLVKTPMM